MIQSLPHGSFRLPALALLVVTVASCGAPTKKASEVAKQFDAQGTKSLQEKSDTTLESFKAYLSSANIQQPPFDFSKYNDVGFKAFPVNSPTSIAFVPIDYIPGSKSGDVVNGAYRGQFWLQKSFVGMASNLSKMLRSNKNTPPGTPVPMKEVGAAGSGLAKAVTPVITFLEASKMDPEEKSFSAKFNLKISGIVQADHDIQIDGKLFENGLAVFIRTTKDQVYEKSLLKNFSAMIIGIPHASDMYLDFSIKMSSYSVGIDDVVKNFLPSALKGAISGSTSGLGQ